MRRNLTRHRLFPLGAAAVLALAACGNGATSTSRTGSSSAMPTPASTSTRAGLPRLGVADNGRSVDLAVGKTATITLVGSSLRWGDPQVDGTAVTISEIISESAAPGRSWSVTARRAGTATVTVVGSPTCRSATPQCMAPDLHWSATFIVR